jgi:hypothetical protein
MIRKCEAHKKIQAQSMTIVASRIEFDALKQIASAAKEAYTVNAGIDCDQENL